jgi:dTDP-4-amino-4,6-dideoxygalactose transaminase
VSKQLTPQLTAVPFLDLGPSHADLAEAILEEIAELLETGRFTNGPQVAEFETSFAEYCGTAYSVGVASGLDALRLALIAGGIEDGDEVIVPANTFIATLEAVTQAGGRPVLVDASEDDYNVDARAVAAAITPRTRFVMPVHLYGQLADVRALQETVGPHGVAILEDACQAHGASRDGTRAGTAGFAGAFSFYPGKNLGAIGDAGALTTDDEELVARVRALREHGQTRKYHHELAGWTARLDTIQALALLHKLPRLDEWNEQRRAAAAHYLEALAGVGDLKLPAVPVGSTPVWHLFVIRTGRVEELQAHLATQGIGTGRHYPEPLHLTAAYEWLGYVEGDFPVAEALSKEVLSLPMFPGISTEQIETVVSAIKDDFAGG